MDGGLGRDSSQDEFDLGLEMIPICPDTSSSTVMETEEFDPFQYPWFSQQYRLQEEIDPVLTTLKHDPNTRGLTCFFQVLNSQVFSNVKGKLGKL